MANRKNPNYPSWYCMTVVKCSKCGEMYEPFCRTMKHICKRQNSYPIKPKVEEENSDG